MNARNMRHNREDVQPRWPAYLKEEESRSFTCVFTYHEQCLTCVQQRCEALGHAGKHIIFCFFFCVPQLYPWGSLLGEILAYVTVCCCCCCCCEILAYVTVCCCCCCCCCEILAYVTVCCCCCCCCCEILAYVTVCCCCCCCCFGIVTFRLRGWCMLSMFYCRHSPV